ncbi:MAG: GatB/YqeY domain-containing protein [Candidatus Staskawiczbacteria bacterium]|nr:GatB/YqeY domain-containing protein [Candidatus Staskawiczbacteria bacterium]
MLKQDIQSAATKALKSGDQMVSGTLRMLLASIISKEKEKRYKISKEKPEALEDQLVKESELTDEQIIEVISYEIKKRRDAIVLYEKGNRPELADKEKKEIEILQNYLPEQLSNDELEKLVQEAIAKTGSKEIKDMGKVMADLNPKVKGKADGGQVSKIVKEFLSK